MNPDAEKEQLEKDEIVKELKIENDDEETLRKAREWDDWKDGMFLWWENLANSWCANLAFGGLKEWPMFFGCFQYILKEKFNILFLTSLLKLALGS